LAEFHFWNSLDLLHDFLVELFYLIMVEEQGGEQVKLILE
jgi:hypothetical protein